MKGAKYIHHAQTSLFPTSSTMITFRRTRSAVMMSISRTYRLMHRYSQTKKINWEECSIRFRTHTKQSYSLNSLHDNKCVSTHLVYYCCRCYQYYLTIIWSVPVSELILCSGLSGYTDESM